MKSIFEFSAGGVVFRDERRTMNDEPLWLICKHSGYHKWVLPKGIVEEGESPEDTAIREVLEETGIKARIIKKIIPDVRYVYTKNGILVRKRVTFYLMKYESGDIADRNWEMEDAKWCSFEEALSLLAFDGERRTLTTASSLMNHKKP